MQRVTSDGSNTNDKKDSDSMTGLVNGLDVKKAPSNETSTSQPSSGLIFGYLNLFSDGVVSSIPLFSMFFHADDAWDNFLGV